MELGSGELRDELVAAVLSGQKTVTSSLHASYLVADEPLPTPGRCHLLDRDDRPIGVVEVTRVEVLRLADVDDTVAHGEGEGYADATAWRRSHEAFWRESGAVAQAEAALPGWHLDDDALVVVETFRRVG
jgi:uncharacterized protein YhfF